MHSWKYLYFSAPLKFPREYVMCCASTLRNSTQLFAAFRLFLLQRPSWTSFSYKKNFLGCWCMSFRQIHTHLSTYNSCIITMKCSNNAITNSSSLSDMNVNPCHINFLYNRKSLCLPLLSKSIKCIQKEVLNSTPNLR